MAKTTGHKIYSDVASAGRREKPFLGPLHMSPVTGLQLGYLDEFCGVFIWEISARSTGMNSRNTTKMVEHKFVLFATFKAFWTLVILLIKLIRILLKWKYTMPLCWPLCCESEAILFKKFRPGHWAGVFIWEIFIPVTEISVTGPVRPLI